MVRVKRQRLACFGPHTMVRAVACGWFVCEMCGLVALCPGCVDVPDGVRVFWCKEHEFLAETAGMAERTVWALKESAW